MVHLTYNDTERRKSAIECKIRAYIPIYPEILLQSVPNQPETIQNAGTAPTGNSLTGSQTAGTDTDQISPERSRQTGAACHGQPMPDFSRLSGRGSVQPVHNSPICHTREVLSAAFCEFFSRIAPNYCYAQLLKQEKPRIC